MILALLLFNLGLAAPAQAEDFPYDTDTSTEVGLLLGSVAAYGLGWWLDRDFRTLIPEEIEALDSDSLNFFDEPATRNWSPEAARWSDRLVTVQVVSPLGLSVAGQGAQQPGKVSLIYLETMALNTGLTYMLKNAFNRSRPLVYNDDPRIPRELQMSHRARKSFPSGHTANAFASMVFFASVYEELNPGAPDTGLVWAGCLTTAALTGILRVTGGWHFSTDVIAGAALGSLIGWAVPRLHEVSDDDSPGNFAQPGLSLNYGFRF